MASQRVVVAMNREIPDAIKSGRLRRDPHARLDVFPIRVS
jgi:transcriptional regulator with PAS, ATPase and Fis domain